MLEQHSIRLDSETRYGFTTRHSSHLNEISSTGSCSNLSEYLSISSQLGIPLIDQCEHFLVMSDLYETVYRDDSRFDYNTAENQKNVMMNMRERLVKETQEVNQASLTEG